MEKTETPPGIGSAPNQTTDNHNTRGTEKNKTGTGRMTREDSQTVERLTDGWY